MGEGLIVRYDKVGGLLFIEVCSPYGGQVSDEIDDGVVGRFNLGTGELESVEVLFFESWLRMEGEVRIPVSVGAGADSDGMVIRYDEAGDVLTMVWGDGGCGGRVEVVGFMARAGRDGGVVLPVGAGLRVTAGALAADRVGG